MTTCYSHFAGIDVSKATFDVTLLVSNTHKRVHKAFSNDLKGFSALLEWLSRQEGFCLDTCLFCMEYTGMYGRKLMYHLLEKGCKLWMEGSLQIKKSLGMTRGKSDKIDSFRIAAYAQTYQGKARIVTTHKKILDQLQDLLSARDRLVKAKKRLLVPIKELTRIDKTQGRNLDIACHPAVEGLKKAIRRVERRIKDLLKEDPEVGQQYELVTSVKGVGPVLALQLIVYTHCFKKIRNARQLACYAGVAPFVYQSGTSINKGSHTSSFANSTLKSTLHLASVSSIQHNPDLKDYYLRKVSQGKNKMSVINAVRNKLLHHIMATVRSGEKYEII